MWAIISNNCWGAGLYQELDIKYNTPTVGLWFQADDYISLLQNFRSTISKPLQFIENSRFGTKTHPVGLLGENIEVQFLHYSSQEEATRKWTSRTARLPVNDDDLYIKICDRDGLEQRHLDAFARLSFKHKVGFFKRGRFNILDYPWAVEVDSACPTVDDGVALWHQIRREGLFDASSWVTSQRSTESSEAPQC